MREHGFPSRYGTLPAVDASAVLSAASPDSMTAYTRVATRCRLADKGTATWCWRIAGDGRGVAVIGDSHAEVVFAGLAARRDGAPLLLTGRKGCAPIIQHERIADLVKEHDQGAVEIATRVFSLQKAESLTLRAAIAASSERITATADTTTNRLAAMSAIRVEDIPRRYNSLFRT
jgi:hypothetical protein